MIIIEGILTVLVLLVSMAMPWVLDFLIKKGIL